MQLFTIGLQKLNMDGSVVVERMASQCPPIHRTM